MPEAEEWALGRPTPSLWSSVPLFIKGTQLESDGIEGSINIRGRGGGGILR